MYGYIYTYESEIKNCNPLLEILLSAPNCGVFCSLGAWKHLIGSGQFFAQLKYFVLLSIPCLSFRKLKLSRFCVSLFYSPPTWIKIVALLILAILFLKESRRSSLNCFLICVHAVMWRSNAQIVEVRLIRQKGKSYRAERDWLWNHTLQINNLKEGVRAGGHGVLWPAWYLVPTSQSTSVSDGPIYTATTSSKPGWLLELSWALASEAPSTRLKGMSCGFLIATHLQAAWWVLLDPFRVKEV